MVHGYTEGRWEVRLPAGAPGGGGEVVLSPEGPPRAHPMFRCRCLRGEELDLTLHLRCQQTPVCLSRGRCEGLGLELPTRGSQSHRVRMGLGCGARGVLF